jgi:hypothetical protein
MVRRVCDDALAEPRDVAEDRWARKQRLSGVEAVG